MPGRERLKLIENTELARKFAPSNAQEFGATMRKSCRKEEAKNPTCQDFKTYRLLWMGTEARSS